MCVNRSTPNSAAVLCRQISTDLRRRQQFICINIDISKMDKKHPEYIEHFVDTFKATIANDAINEMIQNSKRKN